MRTGLVTAGGLTASSSSAASTTTAAPPALVGSIEYSAEVLGSVLLMVLGHESCGAEYHLASGQVQLVT